MTGPRALGRAVTQFEGFETIEVPSNSCLGQVTIKSDELVSLCPVTGQPDISSVQVEFTPDRLYVETKTLKLYFNSFRDRGIFCEEIAQTICNDLFEALSPKLLVVTVRQHPRGGITTEATAVRRGGRTL